MQIKKSKLIQIIKEELSAALFGQWTTEGLKSALLRNATPIKPSNISDKIWNTSIERCLAGESEYCPLNYGVEEYVRPEPQKKEKTDLTKLLKPPSHYKKKKKKPAKPFVSDFDKMYNQLEKLFPPGPNGECGYCEMLRGFAMESESGQTGGVSSHGLRSGINQFRKAVYRKLVSKAPSELTDYNYRSSAYMLSRDHFIDIIKNSRTDLPLSNYLKKHINRLHNIWQRMNSQQRRWLISRINN